MKGFEKTGMEEKRVSTLGSALIWFGAAVSIAEILTGSLLAPLGFRRGAVAVFVGHIIGCALLYLAGLIGANKGKTAMETVKGSFGQKGALVFCVLNIVQLVGWTAVMIIGGARAAAAIADKPLHMNGTALWCVVIGALTLLWLLVGIRNLSRLNLFAMSALFLCTVVLSAAVFKGGSQGSVGGMSFGMAVELSATMPLSWLPLISDYVKSAKRPKAAVAVSAGVYFATSCWMFFIGLGAAIFTGQSDIALIMVQAGLGLIGLVVIVFSTFTTTFLDVYSAGVSFASITNRIRDKWIAVGTCVLGTLLAIFTPIEQYQNFLYFIGSVFAPMTAILITDYFILKKDLSDKRISVTNLIIWGIGFILYRLVLSMDTMVGSTFPVMIIVGLVCILVHGGKKHVHKNPAQR